MSDDRERGDEGFLKRWSRRKRAAAEAPAEAAPALPKAAEPGAPPAAIDPADLPDVDSLDAESDYTVFMQEGVPEELRRLALRKLWRSNPIFANLDGLNDYDLDYSKVGMVDEVVKTAYKIGQGFHDEAEAVEIADAEATDGHATSETEATADTEGLEDMESDASQA